MKILLCSYGISLFFWVAIATPSQEDIPQQQNGSRSQRNTAIWGITEDQLDSLFEHSTDYVALVQDQYLRRVNKRWTDILGWTSEELTSHPYATFLHPKDGSSTSDVVQKGSNVACVINFKNQYRTTKGDYHLVEWFALRQVSGTDRTTPLLAIGKDLTLEQVAQDQRTAIQQAEATARLKSNFVAHMSHELRTPLNGVMGFLDIALQEEMSQTVQSYLEQAQTSAHFLLEVAQDILDVSKIDTNTLKVKFKPFNPTGSIEAVISMLTQQAQKKKLSLVSNVSPNIPSVLWGDENRFKQILLNLMGNALKFTPQGMVSLNLKGEIDQRDPALFVLQGQVKDTGIGIDPQFITQLFRPFSQEDHSMRRQFGGAGLGLYITKQLCEKMGGDISVASTPGIGTSFQFQVVLKSTAPLLSKQSSSFCRLTELETFTADENIKEAKDSVEYQKVKTTIVELPSNGSLELAKEKSIWGIAEEQLDELFGISSNLVCLSAHHFLYRVNKAWINTLKWTEEDLLSRPYTGIIHPQDLPSTESVAHQATQSSSIYNSMSSSNSPKEADSKISMLVNFENRFRTQQGDYRNFQWLTLLQVLGPTNYPPLLSIAKDVTLQKQAEAQKEALEQAQLANKIKSTFVAHMSHEIRTPLNGIMGFIELALDQQMPDQTRSYIKTAHKSALSLLHLANDIVDVSRIEAGALRIEKIDFDPKTSLDHVMDVLQLKARKKNIVLKSSLSASVPSILRGDDMRFKQILLNLGNNAVKFTAQGEVCVDLDGQTLSEQPNVFSLRGTVKDSGIGIEPSSVKKIFEPFSQQDTSIKRSFDGAGLGLFITKELCEKMGGSIQVISTPGLGSTFQFQLRFERPLSPSTVIDKPLTSLDFVRLPVSRVLVVDDHVMNRKVLQILLQRMNCYVDGVEDGSKALEAVAHNSYDLILMDGEMPHVDGLEATRKIRKQFSAQQLPIIGLTAHAMTDHQQQFLDSGMNGYLTKPINREELIKEILGCCKS